METLEKIIVVSFAILSLFFLLIAIGRKIDGGYSKWQVANMVAYSFFYSVGSIAIYLQ